MDGGYNSGLSQYSHGDHANYDKESDEEDGTADCGDVVIEHA